MRSTSNIIFSKQGEIEFSSLLLTQFIESHGLQIKPIDVEPYMLKYQIDLNRRVELLTFILLSSGFVAILVTLYRRSVHHISS